MIDLLPILFIGRSKPLKPNLLQLPHRESSALQQHQPSYDSHEEILYCLLLRSNLITRIFIPGSRGYSLFFPKVKSFYEVCLFLQAGQFYEVKKNCF